MMNWQKDFRVIHIFLLLYLLIFLFFTVFSEFTQGNSSIFSLEEGKNQGSDLILYFRPGNIDLNNTLVSQFRANGNRIWRLILLFVAFSVFLEAIFKIILQKYCFSTYSHEKFIHNLVISYFLGGRAPPFFAY